MTPALLCVAASALLLDVRVSSVPPRAAVRLQVSSHDIAGSGKAVHQHPDVGAAATGVKDILTRSDNDEQSLRASLKLAEEKIGALEQSLQSAARATELLKRELEAEVEAREAAEMMLWMDHESSKPSTIGTGLKRARNWASLPVRAGTSVWQWLRPAASSWAARMPPWC